MLVFKCVGNEKKTSHLVIISGAEVLSVLSAGPPSRGTMQINDTQRPELN